jgi:hypothetical protein
MEPLTAIAIAAAVGGASGKLVETAWSTGSKWLSDYFKDHEEKAKETAQKNALVFLNDLALRVKEIEAALRQTGQTREPIERALDDPDFAAILKTALIASARTSNADKHEILARAVADRLNSPPEGLVALTSALAIDALPHLSANHLNFLGVAAVVYHIRPVPFPPELASHERFGEWYVAWLTQQLAGCLPGLQMTYVDYAHLVSVGCIQYDTIGSRDIKRVLNPPNPETHPWPADKFLSENPLGKHLSDLWKTMNHASLTTTGQLIGIYVHDLTTTQKTTIDW